MADKKRIVVWGTGFVGKMIIPEVLRHPNFELVGVGVNDKDKVGRDAGDICGIGPIGHHRHGRSAGADRPAPRCPGALRAHGRPGRRQHPGHRRLPAGRHRRVLDGHDPVGVAVT